MSDYAATDPTNPNVLAERLRLARSVRRYSQGELAARAGLLQPQVSRIERGQVEAPSFADLVLLSRALGVSLNALADSNPASFLSELTRVADDVERNPLSILDGPIDHPIGHANINSWSPSAIFLDPYNPPENTLPIGLVGPKNESPYVVSTPSTDLSSHALICGQTGTGKTELIKWLVFGAAKAGGPVAVLDPHGNLCDDLLSALIATCPERVDDIVWVDMADSDYPVAFNPLDVHSYGEIEPAVIAALGVLSERGARWPRAMNLATQALVAMCEANWHLGDSRAKCTLPQLADFFLDSEFRDLVMELCTNPEANETFHPENGPFCSLSEKQRQDFTAPILRHIASLGTSEMALNTLSSSQNHLAFRRLIADNSILLVKGSRFSHEHGAGDKLGALTLELLISAAEKCPGQRLRIFAEDAAGLISEQSPVPTRLERQQDNWSLILSTQSPDLLDSSVIETVLSSTQAKFCFNPGAGADASILAGWLPYAGARDVMNLPNYHYFARLPSEPENRIEAVGLPPIKTSLTSYQRVSRDGLKGRTRHWLCNRSTDIPSRDEALSALKGAMQQLLAEYAESGVPEYSLTLDPFDDNDSFKGW